MSLSIYLTPFTRYPQSLQTISLFRPIKPTTISTPPKLSNLPTVRSAHKNFDHPPVATSKPRWENMLSTAASLYPLYVTVGGVVACLRPSTFSWFVKRGPTSYSLALGFIMLAMGLSLELSEFFSLFLQRPLSILFGCVAQFTIMPTFGFFISKALGLSPAVSVGLILLACCPGGTASNVVTLIAQGDVTLSIVMTACTTLGAVILTPLLTKILAGAYVHVDAVKLSISTMQVVVAPILLGSYMQRTFPAAVKLVTPFGPLLAVPAASLLACSVFSENVAQFMALDGLLDGTVKWRPVVLPVFFFQSMLQWGGGPGLNLFLRRFPTRCFDVGIAEQHAVTFTAGLACEGIKPFFAQSTQIPFHEREKREMESVMLSKKWISTVSSIYTMGQTASISSVAPAGTSRTMPSASPIPSAAPPTQSAKEYDFSSLTQGFFSKS